MLDIDLNRAKELFLESSRMIDRLIEIDPTLEPIYQTDLSDYAPLAHPVLLRNGAKSYYQRTRAEIHAGLGTIAMRQGNLSEAEEHFLAALTIAKSLHGSAPATPTLIQLLVSAHQNMAKLALVSGDTSSAEAYAKQALVNHQQLSDAEPMHVGWMKAVQEDLEILARCSDG